MNDENTFTPEEIDRYTTWKTKTPEGRLGDLTNEVSKAIEIALALLPGSAMSMFLSSTNQALIKKMGESDLTAALAAPDTINAFLAFHSEVSRQTEQHHDDTAPMMTLKKDRVKAVYSYFYNIINPDQNDATCAHYRNAIKEALNALGLGAPFSEQELLERSKQLQGIALNPRGERIL